MEALSLATKRSRGKGLGRLASYSKRAASQEVYLSSTRVPGQKQAKIVGHELLPIGGGQTPDQAGRLSTIYAYRLPAAACVTYNAYVRHAVTHARAICKHAPKAALMDRCAIPQLALAAPLPHQPLSSALPITRRTCPTRHDT